MASALPGQLGPVRPLGWQRVLSARGWCPVGGGPASLGSAWGSLCPACFVLTAQGGRSGNGSAIFAGELFALSLQLSPLCSSNVHPHTQAHSHHTHSHIQRQTHSYTNALTLTLTHMRVHIYTLEYTHSFELTLTPACSLSLSLSLSHTHPLSLYLM